MAAMDGIRAQIALGNGEKVFAGTAASGAASAAYDLTQFFDLDGRPVVTQSSQTGSALLEGGFNDQPMLVLQGTQDFNYNFVATSATPAVTTSNGILVKAGQQEYVQPRIGRRFLQLIQNSAGGTVSIFVVKAS